VFQSLYSYPAELSVWAIAIEQEAIERFARDQLKSIEQGLRPIFEPLKVAWQLIQERGHHVDAILRAAERNQADTVVMGSRGLQGVKELLLGSVSSGVLYHAACPVLIVHGDNAPCGTAEFGNIVLASDGSPSAQRAAKVAVEMAEKFATSLTVLNVYENLPVISVPDSGENLFSDADMEAHASKWMQYVAQPIRAFAKEAGVNCSFIQEGGLPDESIIRFADTHDVDLIILGSRGLGGYARMLMGSVSNRVVHHANCPVLVVP
jgi:nucleotide-binding universal stress UspA family protein